MGAINGNSFTLYIGGTAVGLGRSATLNDETDTIDATTKSNSGYNDFLGGLQSASIEFEALADFTTDDALFDAMKNETEVAWVLTDGASATAGNRYSGSGIITSLSITYDMEDVASMSGTITVTTAITQTPAA